MRLLSYFCVGIIFGITVIKSEMASWYRILEMFHFQSFHLIFMITLAIIVALLGVKVVQRFKTIGNKDIIVPQKPEGFIRYPTGGFIFGLGWGTTGLCLGPLFAVVGTGSIGAFIIFLGALHGTWLYGFFRDKIKH